METAGNFEDTENQRDLNRGKCREIILWEKEIMKKNK